MGTTKTPRPAEATYDVCRNGEQWRVLFGGFA